MQPPDKDRRLSHYLYNGGSTILYLRSFFCHKQQGLSICTEQ